MLNIRKIIKDKGWYVVDGVVGVLKDDSLFEHATITPADIGKYKDLNYRLVGDVIKGIDIDKQLIYLEFNGAKLDVSFKRLQSVSVRRALKIHNSDYLTLISLFGELNK
jgi:hypothetical protein